MFAWNWAVCTWRAAICVSSTRVGDSSLDRFWGSTAQGLSVVAGETINSEEIFDKLEEPSEVGDDVDIPVKVPLISLTLYWWCAQAFIYILSEQKLTEAHGKSVWCKFRRGWQQTRGAVTGRCWCWHTCQGTAQNSWVLVMPASTIIDILSEQKLTRPHDKSIWWLLFTGICQEKGCRGISAASSCVSWVWNSWECAEKSKAGATHKRFSSSPHACANCCCFLSIKCLGALSLTWSLWFYWSGENFFNQENSLPLKLSCIGQSWWEVHCEITSEMP